MGASQALVRVQFCVGMYGPASACRVCCAAPGVSCPGDGAHGSIPVLRYCAGWPQGSALARAAGVQYTAAPVPDTRVCRRRHCCREPLEESKWVSDALLLPGEAQKMLQRFREQQQEAAQKEAAAGQAAEAG